jgi:hypothetical protein
LDSLLLLAERDIAMLPAGHFRPRGEHADEEANL